MAVIKRMDPEAEEVLASSGHVCLYTMTVESQQWQRKNVEGSLFLLKRRSSPRFRIMVLNKMSTENYFEDVHAGLDFEVNAPYLMYAKGNSSEIIGIWFYEQHDMHAVEETLSRIKSQMPPPGAAPAAPPVPQPVARTAAPQTPASSSGGAAAATPATAGSSSNDDAFWDKPAKQGAAPGRQLQPAQLPQHPAAVPQQNALQGLLKAAHAKAQAATEQPPPAQPQAPAGASQLLPPSFFQQKGAPVPAPAPAAPAHAPGTGPPPPSGSNAAGAGILDMLRSPQRNAPPAPVPAAAPAPGPPQPGGNTLLKLFANAKKAPAAAAAAPPPPPAVASPRSAPPPPAAAPVAVAAAQPSGLGDREKVQQLLACVATNQALLDMLVVEMRAVGLL